MDDVKIVEMFLERNEDALIYTAEKYGERLKNLSFGIVGDRSTAEECENDTYRKAWNSIPPNEPKNYFYAYLCRIVRHISLDRCRKKEALKRKVHLSELSLELENCLPSADDLEQKMDDKAFADMLNRFLEELNSDKRKIFVRRYFFTDSISDISKIYGLSESKVKTTLFRVRKDLKSYLIKEGYEI